MNDDLLNNENEIKEIENWGNRNGRPNFEYLQSLVADGSIEALNKLRNIAEDLDINFSQNTTMEELMDMIRASIRKNDDSGS